MSHTRRNRNNTPNTPYLNRTYSKPKKHSFTKERTNHTTKKLRNTNSLVKHNYIIQKIGEKSIKNIRNYIEYDLINIKQVLKNFKENIRLFRGFFYLCPIKKHKRFPANFKYPSWYIHLKSTRPYPLFFPFLLQVKHKIILSFRLKRLQN